MKKPLDQAMDDIEKNRAYAALFLNKQAIKVRSVDKRIEAIEKQKAVLEAEKQVELTKMMEYMELGVVLTHTLEADGYTISYDHRRRMDIRSVGEFLRWLKANCETSEVLKFFEGAIKADNLKKFCNKKCDEQRANGIMEPKIDGIDLHEINYKRLTTFYKEKDNANK
jgi:hypothetical protein